VAVTAFFYGLAFTSAFNKEIDIDTDVMKVMLCTSAYTPNQDTHRYKSDITNEVVGTGYTATGQTLASPAVSYTAGTNVWAFDAADSAWATSTITARYAVIYDSSPASDATRPLICYIDFGADVITSGTTFTIQYAAGGIVSVTVA
jgi:hypothetical protein